MSISQPPGNPGTTPTPIRATQELGLVADPRALGLAAFATTTFAFGLSFTTVWSTSAAIASTLELALIFGGAIQILAGIWAFARRLTFPTVAFCSFGAFYVGYYLFQKSLAPGIPAADATTALAVFFLAWLILSTIVCIASFQVSAAAGGVYFFWWLTFLLLVIGLFVRSVDVLIAGGASALVASAIAWYMSGALLVNETVGRELLPLFPAEEMNVGHRLGLHRPRETAA